MVNLSDNHLDIDDCIVLTRSVANRGSKGHFRQLVLKTQRPELSHDSLIKLYEISSSLAVGFSAEKLNVVEDTKSELIFNRNSDENDIARMRTAFTDMVNANKLVAAGEISYKKTVVF